MGSCFSDNIGNHLLDYKFKVSSNPFGVLYNPISVANSLTLILDKLSLEKTNLVEHNGMWHSFDLHGSFSNIDSDELLSKANGILEEAHEKLKNTNYLFITFGTAWVYEHISSKKIVSNCHKIPASQFSRYRLTIDTIYNVWSKLIQRLSDFNPEMEIIFTVSPIRHLKDGAHENQLSKSTLFLAIDQLIQQNNKLSYFPSYEIVMDELRDYRFYADDMTHISSKAIHFIFEKFKETYFEENTIQSMNKVKPIVKATTHKILSDNTQEIEKFAITMLKKIEEIENSHPQIDLTREKAYFNQLKNG